MNQVKAEIRMFGPTKDEFESEYLPDLGQDISKLESMVKYYGENGKLIKEFDAGINEGHSASFVLPLGQREFEAGENKDVLNTIFNTNKALIEKYRESISGTGLANWYVEGDVPTATELESAKSAIESMGGPESVTPVLLNGAVLQDYIEQTCDGHNLIGTGKGRVMKIATLVDIARVMHQSGATNINDLNHAIIWHDTDIRGFDKLEVVRGLASAIFQGCDFAKASFTRAKENGERLYGRVTNVIAIPFIKSLQKLANDNDNNLLALEILAQFRYPCSGEVALTPSMALTLKIPNDFGIEAMNLTEISGKVASHQTTAGDVFLGPYDHYHSSKESLGKMAEEVLTGFMQALKDQDYSIGAQEKDDLVFETLRRMIEAIRLRREKSTQYNLQDIVEDDLSQAESFVGALHRVLKKIKHLEDKPTIKPLSALTKTLGSGGFNFTDFYKAATNEQNWNKEHFVDLNQRERALKEKVKGDEEE